MALGYEGYSTIEGVIFLCTNVDIADSQQKLESSSGYGGDYTPNNSLFSPVNYDWPTIEGSISFDLNDNFLSSVVYPWIFSRDDSADIYARPRGAVSYYRFPESWWTSISLNASTGSAVSGNIGIMAVSRSQSSRSDNYIANKRGVGTAYSYLSSSGAIPALNPSAGQLNPIPFWKTSYSSSPSLNVDLINWNLDFSQNLQRLFKCENNTSQQAPFAVGIGTMTCSLTMDLFLLNETMGGTWSDIPDILTFFYLTVGSKVFKLKDLNIITDSDPVRSPNDLAVVTLQADAYGLDS